MNAKVMKEFVEQKNGLTAEYLEEKVHQQEVTLSFSQAPSFVSLTLWSPQRYTSNTAYSVNIAWFPDDCYVYYALEGSQTSSFYVKFSGKNIELSSLNVSKVFAVGFF